MPPLDVKLDLDYPSNPVLCDFPGLKYSQSIWSHSVDVTGRQRQGDFASETVHHPCQQRVTMCKKTHSVYTGYGSFLAATKICGYA